MNAPTPLDLAASRRLIRILKVALLVSIGLYGFIAWRIPANNRVANPMLYTLIAVVAASTVILVFAIRRILLSRAEEMLASNPHDVQSLGRWRAANIISFAMAESVALYGVVLHFIGCTTRQVAPFFVAGFLLILFLGSSPPASAIKNGPIEPV